MALHKAQSISPEALQTDVLSGKETALVCFMEDWSEPSREMDQTVDMLADALYGKLNVYRIGLDEAPMEAARYGINSIPALVLFVQGEAAQKLFGVRSFEDVMRIIAKHLPP